MNWEAVIGLEVHVQLDTASKAFSGSASRFGDAPNTHTDPVVLGLPGALPTFNKRALEAAVKLGIALGCKIRERSRFARKQYFYPDLPKGYQISQFDEPICEGGAVEFRFGGEDRAVALTRIHLEEDAGKSSHYGRVSLVDLNRAGTPLCEIVSEPMISSASEAAEYLRALRQLVRYLEISEGDLEKGHLRCDANVSVRPIGQAELGTRAELKNINSFRFVEAAIDNEIARQISILEDGGSVVLETRLWDADAGQSRSMRSKEEAADYRYFPDPDLPPLVVPDALRKQVVLELPELPEAKRRRFETDLGLPEDDAALLSSERELADYFEQAITACNAGSDDGANGGDGGKSAKTVANWIGTELLRELGKSESPLAESIDSIAVTPQHLGKLVALIDAGTISGKIAKKVFSQMLDSGELPEVIVEREGWVQISDAGALESIIAEIIASNPGQVSAYRGGKTQLLGFFVGQVMKATGGQANPPLVNELLRKALEP